MHNAILLAFDSLPYIHLYASESKIHQYQCRISFCSVDNLYSWRHFNVAATNILFCYNFATFYVVKSWNGY